MPLLFWSWGSPFSASLLTCSVVKRPLFFRSCGSPYVASLPTARYGHVILIRKRMLSAHTYEPSIIRSPLMFSWCPKLPLHNCFIVGNLGSTVCFSCSTFIIREVRVFLWGKIGFLFICFQSFFRRRFVGADALIGPDRSPRVPAGLYVSVD